MPKYKGVFVSLRGLHHLVFLFFDILTSLYLMITGHLLRAIGKSISLLMFMTGVKQ